MYGGYPVVPPDNEPEDEWQSTEEEKRTDFRLHRILRYVPVGSLIEGETWEELSSSSLLLELSDLAKSHVDMDRIEHLLSKGVPPMTVCQILL